MKIPHRALVAIANGEHFKLMRNVGTPFEPRLEHVEDLDLELTNFSAGVRHQDRSGPPRNSTDIDELAHGAAIAEYLNGRALNGRLDDLVIAADPRTLGQIRQHCHKELKNKVVGELAKDLTNQPLPDIAQALATG